MHRIRKYTGDVTPQIGDRVLPVGYTAGLLMLEHIVLGISEYSTAGTTIWVRPVVERDAEPHRRGSQHVDPDRFKLIKRGEQS